MNKPDAKELVGEITNYVNSFSLKSDEFITAMSHEHRTLQQSFTRLCLKWIEHCASDEYRFDPRNEASHETSKTLIEAYKDKTQMPFNPSEFLPII